MKLKSLLNALFIMLIITPAYAADFSEATSAAAKVFQDLRQVAYVLAAFGLAAFAVSAIFGKISFKWLGLICCGLFILAYAGDLANYITNQNAEGIETQAPKLDGIKDPFMTAGGGGTTTETPNDTSGANDANDLREAEAKLEAKLEAERNLLDATKNANAAANAASTATQNAQTAAQEAAAAEQAVKDAELAHEAAVEAWKDAPTGTRVDQENGKYPEEFLKAQEAAIEAAKAKEAAEAAAEAANLKAAQAAQTAEEANKAALEAEAARKEAEQASAELNTTTTSSSTTVETGSRPMTDQEQYDYLKGKGLIEDNVSLEEYVKARDSANTAMQP